MLISVVIPVYNVEKYLRQCLDSVLAQAFSDYEVICVNDGSTDGSGRILKEYASGNPVVKVIEQKNGGLSAARNAGLKKAEGKYVLFLDSDDWLEKDALQTLADAADGQDMICFNGRRFIEDQDRYEAADDIVPVDEMTGWDYYNKFSLLHRNFAFVCVVLRLYRREFLLENNLWFAEGIYHEDNRFTPLVCYHAGRVRVIDNVLYDYRIRSCSITTTRNIKRDKDLLDTANFLAGFFADKKDCDRTVVFRALTHHYQAPFTRSSREDDKELLPLVDWKLYKAVSRTKARHCLQYLAMRISPSVFRLINKI